MCYNSCWFYLFRDVVAYVFIPIVQRELDDFQEIVWNDKKGRKQARKLLPTGIPTNMYDFPETYGNFNDYGIEVTDEDLNDLTQIDDLAPIFNGELDKMLPDGIQDIFDDIFNNGGFDPLTVTALRDGRFVVLHMIRELTRIFHSA